MNLIYKNCKYINDLFLIQLIYYFTLIDIFALIQISLQLLYRYIIVMSEIIQERKGFCIKIVNKTDRQIIRLIFFSQIICLVPFLIADLVLIYTNDSQCLYAVLNPNFTLGHWIFIDGYVKLFVFFLVCIVTFFDTESASKIYVTCIGNLLRLFYLFDFAWTVVGSDLFWAQNNMFPPYPYPKPFIYGRAYLYCSHPFKIYIYFLLIFSYIVIPINLYIGSMRPNPILRGQMLTGQTTRRDTQLIEKPKTIYQ